MTKKFRTKKSLGQNFLINEGILTKIVNILDASSSDTIVEIGAGTGNLTKKLANIGSRIIAVEKDSRLIDLLKLSFDGMKNVTIVEEDILKFDPKNYGLSATSYKIVGNIPYYLTSHLLRIIYENWPAPESVILTIQKEVAQRIMAKPPHMNLLALSAQLYSNPKIISHVSAGSFRPTPKVDSAIIRLVTRDWELSQREKNEKVLEVAKAGFSSKRKLLINNLAEKIKIPKENLREIFNRLGINLKARAEELNIEKWQKLSGALFN